MEYHKLFHLFSYHLKHLVFYLSKTPRYFSTYKVPFRYTITKTGLLKITLIIETHIEYGKTSLI